MSEKQLKEYRYRIEGCMSNISEDDSDCKIANSLEKELLAKLRFFDEALMKIPTLRKSFEKQDYVKETKQ